MIEPLNHLFLRACLNLRLMRALNSHRGQLVITEPRILKVQYSTSYELANTLVALYLCFDLGSYVKATTSSAFNVVRDCGSD